MKAAATAGPLGPNERLGDRQSRAVDVMVNDIVEDHNARREDDTTYVKRYQKGQYLGKGGFAKCYELKSMDSGKVYAAKVIAKNSLSKPASRKKLLNEIKIHRSLKHSNIVKFERFFEDKDNVYILLELCPKQSLIEMLRRRKQLTETEVQCIMWKLLQVVKYLHGHGVIHRDLKLGNLFLSADMEVKTGDFGLATRLEHPGERKRTMCGTPNYIAPEILEGTNGHSFEVDVWAMGVIMYTLLIGRPPFETASVKSTYKRIRANNYVFPPHTPISTAAKELIIAILHPDPAQRPNLDQIGVAPFFTQSSFPASLPSSCLTHPLAWEQANPNLPCVKLNRPPLSDKMLNVDPQSHDAPKFEGFDGVEVGTANKENRGAPVLAQAESGKPKSLVKVRRSPTAQLVSLRPKSSVLLPSTRSGVLSPQRPVGVPAASLRGPQMRTDVRLSTSPAREAPARSVSKDAPMRCEKEAKLISKLESLQVNDPTEEDKHASKERDDEDAALRTIHDEIEENCRLQVLRESDPRSRVGSKPVPKPIPPEMWVNKWVDYSNKYGLGYLLSNGNTGVHFNDAAMVVMYKTGPTFEHIPRQSSSGPPEPREALHLENYPASLKKKVTLLKHFHQYLQQGVNIGSENGEIVVNGNSDLQSADDGPTNMVYVKKWVRTKHAILFRLSNDLVQVNFYDGTEIILSPDDRMVTYCNKAKERTTYPLATVFQHPLPDVAKRMKYTKDLLHHLLARPVSG